MEKFGNDLHEWKGSFENKVEDFDPDKRLDVKRNEVQESGGEFNPDKRIEPITSEASAEHHGDIDGESEGRTQEEKELLDKLASGKLDGQVGDDFYTSGGSTIWTKIENGMPVRYRQGPTTKFFNGKENERIEGKLSVKQKWETDSEKLEFLQKYGWLMNDEGAQDYSAKFKPGQENPHKESVAERDDRTVIADQVLDGKDVSADETKITRTIDTYNQSLENDCHPITGVPFVRKTVDIGNERVEGVFPVFESKVDIQLPESEYKRSDESQAKYCVTELRKMITENPDLKSQFTERQLEQIMDEKSNGKIDGLSWHHNEEPGKIQLVNQVTHGLTGHTGGALLWGGRYDD